MRLIALALVTCAVALGGCGESGIGSPCTVDPAAGNLQVLRNAGECSTQICVAYLSPNAYCSIECTSNAMCPSLGYACCPVVQTGAQLSCTADVDCERAGYPQLACRQSQCKPRTYCVKGTACQ